MAQTTLTIYAGDQLFKLVDFSTLLFLFFDYMAWEQHGPSVNWDNCWSHCWTVDLVYW